MRRYDSYKDSGVEWIGEIPDNWGVTKMKYVGDYLNGYPFKPTDWGDEGRLIIRIQNLTEGRGSENFYSGEIDPKYIVRTGDYLFSWSTTLGLYEWKRDEGLLNQHIFKVELNDILFKKYYFWVIQGVIKELSNESHGSTMTHLTKDVFGNIRLPLPPLSEQQQIVSYLDTKTSQIDSLIEKTQRKIELLKEKRTSLINEVVTKGLNPKVEMKDSGVEWIGKIPSHWVFSPLKRLVKIGNGKDYKHIEVEEGGYPVYGTGGIFSKCSDFLHTGPSVLLGRKGTINNPLFVNEPFWTSDTIYFTIIDETKIIPTLLFRLVHQIPFDLYSYGSAIPSMTKTDYEEMKFPIPPISEQEEIVSYLDEHTQLIDKTISVEQRRIELLKDYRQSIISEVVTGKRKVTNDD
jgi:type I restriction enzyme S subunit